MLTKRRIHHGSVLFERGAPHDGVVKLSGMLRDPGTQNWLWPELKLAHQEAVAARLGEVVLDLRDLTYSTADGWRILMSWLRLFRETSADGPRLRLLANRDHQWQSVGISTLVIFGGEHLVVETHSSDDTTNLIRNGSRPR